MHPLPSALATCAPASGGAPKSHPVPTSRLLGTRAGRQQGRVAGKGLTGQPAASAGDTAPQHGLACSGADGLTLR